MNVYRPQFSQLNRVFAVLIYLLVIATAIWIADSRVAAEKAEIFPGYVTVEVHQPYFALSTNRTFGSSENARLWLDHRGISNLDFRVYRVNDPQRFFAQLSDPHQMGEEESEQIATTVSKHPSLLERVRTVKAWAYAGIRNYFRDQLQQNTRKSFNQKFRTNETVKRVPLNVADYARVPLLNPNQLVTHWREPLPDVDAYDRRMIPLGKRERGVYLVEAVSDDLRAYTVVVITDLALVEKASPNGEVLVYAVNRKTGQPQPDTRVDMVKANKTVASGRTNADGLFRTTIPKPQETTEDVEHEDENFMILASQQDNFAISDLESFYFGGGENEEENLQGYIYTDRPIYRPNHKVSFKGILRALDEKDGYRTLKSETVTVFVEDSKSARVYQQQLPLSKHGTFSGEFTLGEEALLGTYSITAQTDEGNSPYANFDVAEYKKPEYKVNITTPKPFAPSGSKTKFDINARYFFGAPVADAEVKYYIYRSRYFAYFGDDEGLDHSEEYDEEYAEYGNYYSDLIHDGEGKLDASGQMSVEFDIPESGKDDVWDFQYRLEAQVTDSSRRSINGTATLIATRGNVMATARPDKYVYQKGQTARVNVSTTDYEGRPVSAKLSLKFMLRTYVKVEKKENEYDSDYQMRETELRVGEITTNREGEAVYEFQVTAPGTISIRTVVHEAGKEYVSLGGVFWSASETEWIDDYFYSENLGSIKLVPDKKSYQQGDTARVLAILPYENANLLVTTERENVMSAWHVKAAGKTLILDVPIEKNYAPNVFLSVTFVKDGDMFSSDQRLVIPARDKMLNLEIISNKNEYKPRETASYTILARDADGAPVPDAEVSIGVVDEAIYSVSPDYTRNIRQQFYGMRYNSVETHLSISYYFRGVAGEKPIDLASTKPSYQLADFKNEGDQAQPLIRKEFKDTAYWEPSVVTGKDGRATVKFRLPDNLTTWRATARGVTSDTMVGASRHKVISRKDVILRLETPRFLTQGDTVTLSGIVHNYLKEAKSTQISISVSGARLISPPQQTVTIDKLGQHRIDWQISAPQTGEIRLLAKALTNTESDAVELALDVVPRGLRNNKAERWTTSDEFAQQEFSLNLPASTDLNSRKLRIEVAPSVAGTLFGALDYLTTYPYGCTEQTMSSFLPNIIVSQTLQEFKSASISNREALKKKVERGRNRLYALQHEDGGWGWWTSDESDPFMTAYVVDGLTLAKQAGYEIDDERLARGREKLQSMLNSDIKNAEIRAFIVYALAESGGIDSKHVDKLFAERANLQPYGRALLALTLSLQKMSQRASEVATEIERSASTGNTSAYWQSRRDPAFEFNHNSVEGTALSLKALARIKPDSSLLPLAARWLVSERSNGYYWNSTKDTAFAIFGLIDYVKISRELSPAYDVEVYLNGEAVVVQHINDAMIETLLVARKGAAIGETNHIRVVKRGKGTLYLSASIDYYTNEEQVNAYSSDALEVTREYRRLQVERDGYNLKWSTSPLTGEIRSGDLIVVQLRLRGKAARYVMLEDPIPAGAEQLEQVGNLDLSHVDQNWTDWYSSREFRDRRTVFFFDRFDGDVRVQYAMRVQVPGEFVVAPARAELMYEPSVVANTATGRFVFMDRGQNRNAVASGRQ